MQDIYSDEGKSGTSLRKRDAFKRMMRDAKDQKMDLIICASISRFARNFSDCMTQIAALKTMHPAHPIGVYFETENIYTLNPSSQYSLDIQALLADWESGNKSRRMILSYDQRIMTGQYPVADLMGYRHTKDGQLVIEPEEAKTVRFIFLAFIQGYNYDQIATILTQKKRSTLRGRQEWNGVMVANIMKMNAAGVIWKPGRASWWTTSWARSQRIMGIAALPMSRNITKRLFRRRLHGLHILWHPAAKSAVCRMLW